MPENLIVQYGSFGLLAALVFWTVKWGVPKVLDAHEKTVGAIAECNEKAVGCLVKSFNDETAHCREERIELAKEHRAEREKDQILRAEQSNQIQRVVEVLSRVECIAHIPHTETRKKLVS